MITMIAAVAKNNAIGFKNKLIYWLPRDLKRFKQLTTGHTILMGRRTFESLPKEALPNRRNCVLTTSVSELPGCECFGSWDEFLCTCKPDEEIFIIGGASLYGSLTSGASQLKKSSVSMMSTTRRKRLLMMSLLRRETSHRFCQQTSRERRMRV